MTSRAAALTARPPAAATRLVLAAALLTACACLAVALQGAGGSGAARGSARRAGALEAGISASLSAALGAARAAYWIKGGTREAGARNPAQGLGERFTPSGVHVSSRRARLTVSLRAIGYGGKLAAAPAPAMRASRNRLEYVRAGVREWYLNGPLGLEQGFTVTRAPTARASAGPLTVSLLLAGDSRPERAGAGRLVFRSRGGGELSYGGLVARDADGRALPATLQLHGSTVLLRVDVARARFPVTIDPIISGSEGQVELKPQHGSRDGELYGTSVALSSDGDTAIVGAPGPPGSGSAVIFVREGVEWVEQRQLTQPAGTHEGSEEGEAHCRPPTAQSACAFGESVGISGDGDVAIIGDPPTAGGTGAAYIYQRSGTTWTRTSELAPPKQSHGQGFGESVAIAADGEAAIVGAPDGQRDEGQAWVFQSRGGSWLGAAGEALEAPASGEKRHLAQSVAISADGHEALLGAPTEGAAGAAFTFVDGSAGWEEVQRLVGERAGSLFGSGVALSANGENALIGAPHETQESLADAGAALLYTLARGKPTGSPQKLTAASRNVPAEAKAEFGASVALFGNGESVPVGALVGAPGAQPKGAHQPVYEGRAWLFGRPAADSEAREVLGYEAGGDTAGQFASAVAIEASGETILAGAPHAGGGEEEGGAWVFGRRPKIVSISPADGPAVGGTLVALKGENLADVRAVMFGSVSAKFEPAVPAIAEGATATAEAPAEEATEEIVAIAPPGAGPVAVSVETPLWEGVANRKDRYVYESANGGGGGKGGQFGDEGTGSPPTGLIIPNEPQLQVLGTTSTSRRCAVRSRSATIAVSRSGRAEVTLLSSGSGDCAGTVTLRAEVRAHGRSRTESLGSASYSLVAGHRERLLVKLDTAARSLLASHGGRVHATLLLERSEPSPPRATSASVTLAKRG